MGTMTVRENIFFSAKLRLPDTISNDKKMEMVDNVIEELGLTHVADSKVWTPCFIIPKHVLLRYVLMPYKLFYAICVILRNKNSIMILQRVNQFPSIIIKYLIIYT